MMERIYDGRMADGTRHFACLPETYDPKTPQWDRLHAHVAGLEGAKVTCFVTDRVTEAWIDFDCGGHSFSINNQQGEWWFFVDDAACPTELLARVLDHFEALLDPRALMARRQVTDGNGS